MTNQLRIYNSKTGKVEDFVAIKERKVDMYVCGPTVYNYAHIGNARPIVVFDTLRRVLEANGYQVEYISNVTDVDDKIIQKAISEGVEETEITTRYLAAYLQLRKALKTEELAAMPTVTENMPAIIDFIAKLLEKGYAYQSEGDVYFRVNKIADYGVFSRQNLSELEVGARVEENTKKENPLDFALWKKTEQGIKWQSPFGEGRPGWHTECVVMIDTHFHDKIDIHGGGLDLRFPHHENEIAQAKAAFNHDIANYWIYNGMINIDGEKMSKSLGNELLAQDVIDRLGVANTRWILLGAHYRAQLQFSEELISQTAAELFKITQALKQAHLQIALQDYQSSEYDTVAYQAFLDCLNDDLNTPNAYAVIFETVKEINQDLRQRDLDIKALSAKVKALELMLSLLGIEQEAFVLSAEDRQLYNNWQTAKAAKDFEIADKYRQQLSDKGIV